MSAEESRPEAPSTEVFAVYGVGARNPGLRHGQIFAIGTFDEGVAPRNQHPKSRKISQHILFSIRTPLHR